jgi:hypothetical protein
MMNTSNAIVGVVVVVAFTFALSSSFVHGQNGWNQQQGQCRIY